jgi:hypothetical protein
MTEVTCTVITYESIKVDIRFPLYRKHDMMLDEADVIAYTRVTEDGWALTITSRHDYRNRTIGFEIERSRVFTPGDRIHFSDRSGREYQLGEKQYACSAEEFDRVMAQAQLWMFPPQAANTSVL